MEAAFTRSPLPLTEHRGLYHIYRPHRLPCHRGMGTSHAKAADTARFSSDWPKFRPIRQAIQYLSGTTIPPGKRRQRGVSPADRLGPDQAALPVAIGRPAVSVRRRCPLDAPGGIAVRRLAGTIRRLRPLYPPAPVAKDDSSVRVPLRRLLKTSERIAVRRPSVGIRLPRSRQASRTVPVRDLAGAVNGHAALQPSSGVAIDGAAARLDLNGSLGSSQTIAVRRLALPVAHDRALQPPLPVAKRGPSVPVRRHRADNAPLRIPVRDNLRRAQARAEADHGERQPVFPHVPGQPPFLGGRRNGCQNRSRRHLVSAPLP